jgi:hypothetical protein
VLAAAIKMDIPFDAAPGAFGMSKKTLSVMGKMCLFYMLEVEHVAPPPLIRFLLLKSAFIDYT